MARRLNDTAALTGAGNGEAEHSIRTRKIDNGYLVCESRCDPRTGEYSHSETFMENPPRIIPGRVARGAPVDAGSSLDDTMRYLKETP